MGRCVFVLITIIIATNIKIMIIIKMINLISRQVSLVSWVYKTGQGSGFRWESHKFAKYCRCVSVYDFVAPSLFCRPTSGDPWAAKRAEVEEDWLHQVAWLQDYRHYMVMISRVITTQETPCYTIMNVSSLWAWLLIISKSLLFQDAGWIWAHSLRDSDGWYPQQAVQAEQGGSMMVTMITMTMTCYRWSCWCDHVGREDDDDIFAGASCNATEGETGGSRCNSGLHPKPASSQTGELFSWGKIMPGQK